MTTTEAAQIRPAYAPVNGLRLYYETRGPLQGTPLIVLHGGFGNTEMFGGLLEELATSRPVIAVDLQGHGRTADIDRPMSLAVLGDDVAGLIEHLGCGMADVLGYSMGGSAALRTAVQHPSLVHKLVLVSAPFRQDGWYPEMVQGMSQMSRAGFEFMKLTPMYSSYAAIAPNPDGFPELMDKMGEMLARPYDLTTEVKALSMPVMIVVGDADGLPPSHAVEFFQLLGGGQRDGGWDRSGVSRSRLAIMPGTTHYETYAKPELIGLVASFLAED